jgi:molybdopterin adenylyltransferase
MPSAHTANHRARIGSCFGLSPRFWARPNDAGAAAQPRQRFPDGHRMSESQELLIGLVSISDRASAGVYEDKGIPGLREWFTAALSTPWRMETRLIPDEQALIERTLVELVDTVGCDLVLTTGGTGPAPRDVTPEATLAVAHKLLPGFGEQMRQVSLRYVPTAILSRQAGVIRGRALILNLPGQPKAIKETLDGVFPAVPYCLDLIGGPYVETHDEVCKAFRPKSAIKG